MAAMRDFTTTDLDGCLAVFDSNVPKFFKTDERDEFIGFLQALPGPYYVIEDEKGQIVACGGYGIKPGTSIADLCWGMVRQDLHGSGLGRLLTEERMRRALALEDISDFALSTSQLTTGFYEQMGFRTVDSTPNGIAPGLDRCEMRCPALNRHFNSGGSR
jgi:N-acetylglutamate synthase-like GNAT family acetyltransferase